MNLRRVFEIAGVALMVALAIVAFTSYRAGRAWEHRAEVAVHASDSLRHVAVVERVKARLASDRAAALARSIPRERQARISRIMHDTIVPATLPECLIDRDSLRAGLLASDSSVRVLMLENEQLRRANALEHAAGSVLLRAVDTVTVTLRERPSFHWTVPSVGFGPFVGVCQDERPCYGFGVQLHWRVPLL